MPTVAPFGAWRSPVTPELVAGAGVVLSSCQPAGEGVCWLEGRPLEGGRYVLVRRDPDGRVADLTPPGFSVRSRVHEYGGGAFAVHGDYVYFSNDADQRLYRQPLQGGSPTPITPEPGRPMGERYADLTFTPDGRWIICVRERHEGDGVHNDLAVLPPDGSAEPRTLVRGNDFYSSPRVGPDGRLLAWITWNHPNMPWDGTELWTAQISSEGELGPSRLVAGGADESIFQPEWSPSGVLHFVSDRTGWWNLYRLRDGEAEVLMPMEAEFGTAQWLFGMTRYAVVDESRLACVYSREGRHHLAVLDLGEGRLQDLDVAYTYVGEAISCSNSRLFFVGATPTEPSAAVVHDLATGREEILRRSLDVELDSGFVSPPRPISFPTESGATAHALFYPPANHDHAGPQGQRPPLIVMSHGGPTGQTPVAFLLQVQFWTSRGFAVADVNYRGSTGYGRSFRDALKGQWGVADVEDCVSAALFLAGSGEVDGRRLAIRGGSAGGYTTLCALTFRGEFAAGASYFGIGDLETMVRDTHKFESRYLDALIGPYPEALEVYRERSPVRHIDRMSTPVIIFQGLEDAVVPPNQAEDMVIALRKKGTPFAYLAFEGEQHGFRKADTNRRCLEAELYFYSRVFRFELADPVAPVEIENL